MGGSKLWPADHQEDKQKKRIEAGSYWIRSTRDGSGADDMAESLDQFNAPQWYRDLLVDPDRDFLVQANNWDYLLTFQRMQTQWVKDMGTPVGLNYQSLEVLLNVQRIPRKERDEYLAAIQDFELGALQEIAKVK